MTDVSQAIEIDRNDRYRISVSAETQSSHYEIRLYIPDGAGGYKDGQVVGYGDGSHSQWIGTGSEIEGSLVQICVSHDGNSVAGGCDVLVRLDLDRGSGVVEHLHSWTIRKGLASADAKCMTLQFK